MRDVSDVLGELIGLRAVVNLVILPERAQVGYIGHFAKKVVGELIQLVQEFIGHQLPLYVKGEAGLIDPAVQPGTAICRINVLRDKGEVHFGIVPREEYVLASVIETGLVNLIPAYHLGHVLIVSVEVVETRIDIILSGLYVVGDSTIQWATCL